MSIKLYKWSSVTQDTQIMWCPKNVRPYNVYEAAEYLMTHGKLFKDQGITFDRNWAANNDELNNDGEIDG